jgi:hypothetical protein
MDSGGERVGSLCRPHLADRLVDTAERQKQTHGKVGPGRRITGVEFNRTTEALFGLLPFPRARVSHAERGVGFRQQWIQLNRLLRCRLHGREFLIMGTVRAG